MTILLRSSRAWSAPLHLIRCRFHLSSRSDHTVAHNKIPSADPRVEGLGDVIEDQFANIRDKYETPKNPIVLAHGLFGFEELRLAGHLLPGVQYWRGIKEALAANGIEVIITSVPPSASIEQRAERLAADIGRKAAGKSVNIIAGLDSRFMISQLKPPNLSVLSLTTIASPHRGSAMADWVFHHIPPNRLPRVYNALDYLQVDTGAFDQLTRRYMQEIFNPKTPDREGTRYFSYGASVQPSPLSAFRTSHRIIESIEGPNDGLVSVASSKWGTYKGTLLGVSHLDLINWTNRLRWWIWQMAGNRRTFNAIAFYLDIADMLAKEGL